VHQAAHEGADERIVPVDANGVVDMDAMAAALRDDVAVCSVMWVNNEVGVIQPVRAIAERAKAAGAVMHSDGVQAFGKIPVDVREIPLDSFTLSGHKIGAPKGIGAIFIRRGTPLEPLFHGGSQDRGRRPGTENVAAAVGLARAAELAMQEREAEMEKLRALRDELQRALCERIPDVVVHAAGAERAPHILNISVPGTDSESLLMALDLAGVACSSGSACQSGNVDPSHVLAAMGVPRELAAAAVRMSLGSLSTPEHVQRVSLLFPSLITKARRLAGVMA
jgi:cysteine desulfurase